MSLSLKVTGVNCEADCAYCYQDALRKANRDWEFDLRKLTGQLEKEYSSGRFKGSVPFLHGGEALDKDLETLDKILSKVYQLAKRTSVQTYCRTLTEEHIAMFKRYNTSVGISIDGPWPLNELRKVPGKDGKKMTETVMKNIRRLKDAGISVSIICVLHKKNATGKRLERLKDWLKELKSIGITGGRLNPMISAYYGKEHELTRVEAANAWRSLARFVLTELPGTNWKPITDAVESLIGKSQGTCIFGQCMYYMAHAEPVILPNGETANCLKSGSVNGDVYPRTEQKSFSKEFGQIRYQILPQIEQADGGCKGCEYWVNCQAGCPAAGIDNDWRNKTRFCLAYKALYGEVSTLIKSLFPAITLTSDVVGRYKPEELVNGIHSLKFDPFASLREGRRGCGPQPEKRPGKQQEGEHTDGGIRHLDSDANHLDSGGKEDNRWVTPTEHIDGGMRHLDSDIQGGVE